MILSINLPEKVVKKIDTERGDVPRSRFILRIIEKVYRIDLSFGFDVCSYPYFTLNNIHL